MSCHFSRAERETLLRADMKFFAMVRVFVASVAVATPEPVLQADGTANQARGFGGPVPSVSRSFEFIWVLLWSSFFVVYWP